MSIVEMLGESATAALDILNDASAWLVLSFALAGVLHGFLRPERLQRMLGHKGIGPLIKGTVSGMLLPICSCGVIPLGLGLYYSGACLGPTLAFMTATPIINPAALLLSFGLLGPEIGIIYLVSGFLVPLVAGLAGNALGGPEIRAPGFSASSATAAGSDAAGEEEASPWRERLTFGLRWSFSELGPMVGKYIVTGILLAGLIIGFIPKSFIQNVLGDPGMISLAGIAVLGTVMYVCAVGHIPFIAALVASGASPGVAIVFLMTGAATNLPELISISRTIGRRAVLIYVMVMVGTSLAIGYATNLLLLPDFLPVFDPGRAVRVTGIASALILAVPRSVSFLCSGVVVVLAVLPYVGWLRERLARATA